MKGYKTALVSLAVIIIGALDSFAWDQIIPDSVEQWVLPAIGAVFLYLRSITTTAMGQSE